MFVADVKCSQATVPNTRTGSTKASVSEAVVRTLVTDNVSNCFVIPQTIPITRHKQVHE